MLSDSDYLLDMLAKENVSRARALVWQRRLALTVEGTVRETRRQARPTLLLLFRMLIRMFRYGRSELKPTMAATRQDREMNHIPCLAVSLVALLVPIGGPIPQVVAGVQMGPVRLGMEADDGARAALAFGQSTGCHIDLLIVAGKVAATGTSFGGCLDVFVPRDMRRIAGRVGFDPPPASPYVDGPASSFIAAFGAHSEVRLGPHRVALMWPAGLIAHVAEASTEAGGGMVTYLAVVAPGSKVVPPIGYFSKPSL